MKLCFEGFGVFIAPGKQQKQSVPEKAHVGVACVSGRGWPGAEWAVGRGGGPPLSENKLAYKSSENVECKNRRTEPSSGNRLCDMYLD